MWSDGHPKLKAITSNERVHVCLRPWCIKWIVWRRGKSRLVVISMNCGRMIGMHPTIVWRSSEKLGM